MTDYYDTEEYVRTLKPGEIRISKRLDFGDGAMRYAETRLEDSESMLEYAMEKGEVVLRETPKGARQLKARFFETNRHVYQLTLNFFTKRTGNPHTGSFPLHGDELPKLLEFIRDLQRVHLTPNKLTVESGALEHKHFTDDDLIAALREKPDLLAQIVETQATSGDIKAIGFRRKSLVRFEKLLSNESFFEAERARVPRKSAEQVWQNFFEKNQWIFGYGLSYIFLSAVDEDRLETEVSGYSVAWKGKRPDAVMKTRGAVNALCLVEIKTHNTSLLHAGTPARPGAFGISKDLTDAISQSQVSVLAAARTLNQAFTPVDKLGDPTSGPVYNYLPRSFVIAGQLSEFKSKHGLNEERFSSFEMFRRNLTSPEIITYDELYERAKYIVEHS